MSEYIRQVKPGSRNVYIEVISNCALNSFQQDKKFPLFFLGEINKGRLYVFILVGKINSFLNSFSKNFVLKSIGH